jgi:uncharacterized membrane protein
MWHRLKRGIHKSLAGKAEESQAFLAFMALGILIPYFLFASGFIYEVTRQDVTDKIDTPYSIALSSYRLDLAGVFYWQDGAAAKWLTQQADYETKVYTDYHASKPLVFYEFPGQIVSLPLDAGKLSEDNYFYFSTWNMDTGELTFAVSSGLRKHVSFDGIPGLITAMEGKNRVYSNGGAQILAPR